ncbi:MAG: hypothetical protein R6V48_08355 [Fidelibacterota bacterium]
MKNNVKNIQIILFLGALWGIAEASIGYVLHFLPAGFSGMLMFPIGFYFMYNAYRQTDSQNAVLWMGLIAAGIKCVDLLLPLRSAMGVLNPAASIIIESMAVFAFVRFYNKKKVVLPVLLTSTAWIVVFTLTQAVVFKPLSGLYLQPLSIILFVVLLNILCSTLIIAIYLKKEKHISFALRLRKSSFALPVMMLGIALLLELTNSLAG